MPKADDYRPLELVEPVTTERMYSLTELWELMKEYVSKVEKKSGQYDTMMRLDLSAFHEYLKKREREVGDGKV